MAEMVADMSSLHHQIDQAFLIFLECIEKHGKAWVRGQEATHVLHVVGGHIK